MNKQETAQIITLLAGNYNSIAEKTKEQKKMMLNTWYECLNDLGYKVILQAVKKTILESPYPPTIHEVRKNAIEIINPVTQKTGIEAWNEAYLMICNGIYMTEEQFNQASPSVKKFFGNVRQVKELAQTDLKTVNSVVKGQFLKQYDVIIEKEKQKKLLPQQMQNFIAQISEKMDIKRLEE